ncbi:MAG TPA: hypothetical protein VN228_19065 [Pyrinomonadaceae bacterium]|nr:hypothetical protein [Pyrinomonadaceae bacterium]
MRPSSRLLVSAIILLSLVPAASAQKKQLCPKAPPSPFKHNGRIVTSLGRGGARTTLEHPHALGRGADPLYMGASFVHVDPRRPATPTLELILYTGAPAARLDAGQGLALVYDGQPLDAARHASFRSQGGAQAARVALPYAEVVKLTRARKVTARVGAAEYEFTNNHLEALRELVSQMAPSPGRWTTADAGAR